MKIEKHYEAFARQELESLQAEADQEAANMTPAEQAAENQKIQADFQRMMDKYALLKKHSHRVLNPQKWKTFERIYQKALAMARIMEADICIESDETDSATITLYATSFIFQQGYSGAAAEIFCELMAHARDAWLLPKDERIKIVFWFDIHDEFIRTDLIAKDQNP